jgi:dipeptidyl aminopeptidase/acylaminoacyl peptidase
MTRGFLAAAALLSLCAPGRLLGADEVVAPNESLVVDGIPAIPRSLAERVQPYEETRAASLLDWHPVKRELLVATRFADVMQVHRVASPGGARTQLTFYPDRILAARWRPRLADGFVFAMDTGGGEFYQLYFRDVKTGRTTMFTDGKSRNERGVFSPDGRLFYHSSTRRNGKDTDLYEVNPTDASTARLVLQVEGGGWGVHDVSPDGKTLLVEEYLSVVESRLHLVDVATGKTTTLFPKAEGTTPMVAYSNAVFGRDGTGIYFTTDKDSEFRRLAYLELSAGSVQILTPEIPWNVGSVELSDDGKRLAFVVNEEGSETLHVLDVASRKALPLSRLPLGTIGSVRFHSNSRDLAFSMSSARSPTDVYSVDLDTGKLERWTESETGGLDASTFSEPQRIRWKSFDGRMISGFLYRPPARFSGRRPVLINIHGGPEAQYQPGFLGRNNYFISELGMAMICPNVRGSSGFGKSFVSLDDGERREDSVKDIGALLDWIAAQPDLDASRVVVAGGSYGGYMTLASMTQFNDRLRGGIDSVGISSFVTFLEHTESYRRDLRRKEYGDERDPKMRELLLRISPLTNASRITKPLLIVQGFNDPRVPHTEAEQMVAAIKKNGGPVWFLMAKDEGHGFAKKKNADFQFLAMVRFLEELVLK